MERATHSIPCDARQVGLCDDLEKGESALVRSPEPQREKGERSCMYVIGRRGGFGSPKDSDLGRCHLRAASTAPKSLAIIWKSTPVRQTEPNRAQNPAESRNRAREANKPLEASGLSG